MVIDIRYRTIDSIYYQSTQAKTDRNDLSDEEIVNKCLDHLHQTTTITLANWYITNLKIS